MTSHEEEFVEFAAASAPRLRRAAFLLCGDWHTAEDLAQTALAKVFVSWRKVRRQEAAYAYATRTLVNCYLADKRLRRSTEILTDQLPDHPAVLPAPETRMVVLDALATLPPRSRAVVVLRYWADLSVDQAADVLGCSPGTVKTLGARSRDRLRAVLGDALADPGPPRHPDFIAITPDGKTVYVATSATHTVTPIDTATNTPGKPIKVGWYPGWIAITPDGKTAYVRTSSGVTPISTATNKPGKPTRMHTGLGFAQIAITPDGKTAYATSGIPAGRRSGTATLIPINTATNAPGKPIDVGKGSSGGGIVFTPDGRTAYVVTVIPGECPGKCGIGTAMVIPVSTATGTPGTAIKVGSCRCLGGGGDGVIAITPDGKTVYVLTGSTVTPISTATGVPGKPIHVGAGRFGSSMAISTATYTPGKPIQVLGRWPMTIVITP